MGKTHLLSGAVAGIGVSAALDVPLQMVPVVVFVTAFSALVPDMDHPSARASNMLPPITWGLCWLIRNLSVWTTGQAHRGLSHSFLFALGWGVTVAGVSAIWLPVQAVVWLGLSAAAGSSVGFLGDVITVQGCQYVMWPATVQVSVPRAVRIRTGGTGETVVGWVLIAGGVAMLPLVLR